MPVITLTAPPQCSQVKMWIWNTRFKRCAHVIERWRVGAGSLAVCFVRGPLLTGVTCSPSPDVSPCQSLKGSLCES